MQDRDDVVNRVRWVLGEETPDEPHCDACRKFAGEYESYQAMLVITEEAVPGYFEGWASPDEEEYELNPGNFKGVACWGMCRCRLEMQVNGRWGKV